MTQKILFFVAGFILARYLILQKYKTNYKQVENQAISTVQNNVEDFLAEWFPEASQEEIKETASNLTKV